MKLRKNIALSDSGFLFNPSTGDSFTLNPIGQELIKLMQQGKASDGILAHLVSKYDVDELTAHKDFDDFKNMLARYKLIE